jgi:hypothetical protein
MRQDAVAAGIALAAWSAPSPAQGRLRTVTTTDDLAAITREVGARLLVIPLSVGGSKAIQTCFQLFDGNIAEIVGAARQLAGGPPAAKP